MFDVVVRTFREWNEDKAAQLAAAIAYYTIFSIAPMLIIALAIAGYFFSADTARNQLISQLGSFIGPQAADFVKTLLQNSNQLSGGLIPSLISIVVLLLGASGIFLQIQDSLNTIWDVPKTQNRGVKTTIKNRFVSFLMVLGIGFLFLVFLILSSVVSVLMNSLNGNPQNKLIAEIINFLVMFLIITVLVAMIFRGVPDKEITWGDVWLGGAVTALLFMLGRYAIGFYLTISKSGSAYGAAGSLIVLLIWIYYSAQIFLLGAEFTQVYARKFGSHKHSESKLESEHIDMSDKNIATQ